MNTCGCEKLYGKRECPELKDDLSESRHFSKVTLGTIKSNPEDLDVFEDHADSSLEEIYACTENIACTKKFHKDYKKIVKYFHNYHESLYNDYKSRKIGKALKLIKCSKKDIYKIFLNNYGDLKYCKFNMEDGTYNKKKGLYFFSINDKCPIYIGSTTNNYKQRIDNGYGNISSSSCYKNGNPTNCRINSKINKHKNDISLWVHPIGENCKGCKGKNKCKDCNDSDDVIKILEDYFIKKYNPLWNLK